MLDIFTPLFDLIAPPPESVRIIRPYQPDDMIRYFAPSKVIDTIALANFHTPVIHAAVVANKFHNEQKGAQLLAPLLTHWLSTLPPKKTCLVPIPLGPQRIKKRGYNQVERILKQITYHKADMSPLLTRTRDTTPQTELSREARFRNITDAFSLSKSVPTQYERFIIVDDVITTGATMRAASLTLAPHLPPDSELLTVAIAH
jgi:ComF family protein